MPLTLDVRHLQLVQEIAATGSLTRAAERLHLTQSALSHQLREIESRLDLKLFLRLGRKMVLTPAGKRVLGVAQRVIAEIAKAEDDLRAMTSDGRGLLRLCTQCNTGYYWLPPLLQAFHGTFPAVQVQIVVDATDHPLKALREGQIDLAVMTSPVRERRLLSRPLFQDELVAVLHPLHPLASRSYLRPQDFSKEHLIVYHANRRDSYAFQHILSPAGVEPARVSQVPLTEAIVELIKAGLGVGILARWAIEPSIASGSIRAVRITRGGVRRQWSAVTLRDRAEPRWQREFVTLLSRQAPGRPMTIAD
jgi:LysR family transcriptional regulator for metE and metH